jgi:hypothetical protein
VLVLAGAGLGKSRLVSEFVTSSAQHAKALIAQEFRMSHSSNIERSHRAFPAGGCRNPARLHVR